jgi:thiamine pyrophosphate-dependent acetolactate synthase large subunit-like protein
VEKLTVYDVLSQAIKAEGVTHHFTLMGDANMHLATVMAHKYGFKTIHARHEHCALAMADGFSRVSGEVGFASVTCGPGFTQTATALTMAARGNVPLVVFAGDSPSNATYHVQAYDPGPLTHATGAHYVNARSIDRLLDNVREAFHVARHDSRPVVLNVPQDWQKANWPHMFNYRPSTEFVPTAQRPGPDPQIVSRVVDMIAAAKAPVILGGRGVALSGAEEALRKIGERIGALYGTSLLGKGLFDDSEWSLGIAGVFAPPVARECWAKADLVLGVGAIMAFYTTESGYLYPNAQVVQIDANPRGLHQGLRIADLYVKADAKAACEAILAELERRGISGKGARTPELAEKLVPSVTRPDQKPYNIQPGQVDPREALFELDRVVPKDWEIVVGSSHFFSTTLTHLRGRLPLRFHIINNFGAIGSAFSAAIGIAASKPGKVLLIEGDGSMMQHIQELETINRHGLKLLMAVMNDGCYASEKHKFISQGIDPSEAIHGRGNLEGVAKAFGLEAATIRKLGQMDRLFADYQKSDKAALWDIHIDDMIPSMLFRRVWFGEKE